MNAATYLEPSDWYASLPTVYASACVLFTDVEDRVLLVKPNYRPYWAVPGGTVEADESPHACAVREIAEELGLAAEVEDLLVVSWTPAFGQRPRPMINFLFDGGILESPERVNLQYDELDEFRFWPWDEAQGQLPSHMAARVSAAQRARKEQRTIYLAGRDGTTSDPSHR